MYLIYYDEVKYDPPKQSAYWIGGICISPSKAVEAETAVNELSQEIFEDKSLVKETEFHAKDIFHGKGNFKGVEIERRISILARLLEILCDPEIYLIYSRLKVAENRYGGDPAEIAFMFFVEKVDVFLRSRNEYGMLFGDFDQPKIGPSVVSLSRFRDAGTYWQGGRSITQLVDTVHFAQSHHSRLVQLADIYLYSEQFTRQDNNAPWRKALLTEINNRQRGLFPTKYKEYPHF